jgi:hypothetical protein
MIDSYFSNEADSTSTSIYLNNNIIISSAPKTHLALLGTPRRTPLGLQGPVNSRVCTDQVAALVGLFVLGCACNADSRVVALFGNQGYVPQLSPPLGVRAARLHHK